MWFLVVIVVSFLSAVQCINNNSAIDILLMIYFTMIIIVHVEYCFSIIIHGISNNMYIRWLSKPFLLDVL